MINRVRKILAGVGALALALVIAFLSGRKSEKVDQKIDDLRDANEAQTKRDEINENVRKDDDLIGRADRAGILRDD
jgi:hypothetical protein